MEKDYGPARIALDCLGCKLNQAEVEALARQLAGAGYEVVSTDEHPDVYILNTCTVTRIADRKSRHLLRMARRRSPDARLIALGCYAGRAPQELLRLEGVDLVLPNDAKSDMVRRLEESGCLSPITPNRARPGYREGKTRAFIKAQDGCSRYCSYCIVPLVRGAEKSVPAGKVIEEVKQVTGAGFQEIVLTGTEIGSYRHGNLELAGLIGRVLAESGIARLRLSSLQPQEISRGLIGLWQDSRLCPHFHLSLQSGSNTVLRRMKRQYTTAGYAGAVSLIREALPEAAITTDVIVGFPGETDMEFQDGLDFCKQARFARIHVFPFSPRQGTAAVVMPHQVSDTVKKERTSQMLALAADSARRFHERFLGKSMNVLWEKQAAGVWSGYTANYIRVYARAGDDLTNRLLPAKLAGLYRDGMRGEAEGSL